MFNIKVNKNIFNIFYMLFKNKNIFLFFKFNILIYIFNIFTLNYDDG